VVAAVVVGLLRSSLVPAVASLIPAVASLVPAVASLVPAVASLVIAIASLVIAVASLVPAVVVVGSRGCCRWFLRIPFAFNLVPVDPLLLLVFKLT